MEEVLTIPSHWSDSEKWVWGKIVKGETADFNSRKSTSKFLDPSKGTGWKNNRRISADFVKTILSDHEYLNQIPANGVTIEGALFDSSEVNLKNFRISHQFSLINSRIQNDLIFSKIIVEGELNFRGSFIGRVELTGASISRSLNLSNTTILGTLDLSDTNIGANLDLTNSTFNKKVNLKSAKIQGSVLLGKNAIFKDELNFVSVFIGSSLDMQGSTFEKLIDFSGSTINGITLICNQANLKGELKFISAVLGSDLEMQGSTFHNIVSLNGARIEGSAYLKDGAIFKSEIDFTSVKIASNLEMNSSTFEKKINLNSAKIGEHALLNAGAVFKGDIDLVLSNVGSNLELYGSIFEKKVNINSAKIGGSVYINKQSSIKGKIDLVSATIGRNLDLSGSHFHSELIFVQVNISGSLYMQGSTFEKKVILNSAKINERAFLRFNAIFKDELDLGGAFIGTHLELIRSRFYDQVNLYGIRIGAILNMQGSTFEKKVNLNNAKVEGPAYLHDGATFKGDLILTNTFFGSFLQMRTSTFEGNLNLTGINIEDILDFQSSTFLKEVNLNRAKIQGSVYIRNGANLKDKLDIGSAMIGSDLDMRGSIFEGEVNLDSIEISQSAQLSGKAIFHKKILFRLATIGKNLNMTNSEFNNKVVVANSVIGLSLFLNKSTFRNTLDLSSCSIVNDFIMGFNRNDTVRFKDNSSLLLNNTEVGALQDWWQDKKSNSWPEAYQLEGFIYNNLGSRNTESISPMMSRPVDFFIDWLANDTISSNQPYQYLSNIFHRLNEINKSNEILYAARERQRKKAWSKKDSFGAIKKRDWSAATGLYILKIIIGYGIGNRYFRVLWWVGGFTIIGMTILTCLGTLTLNQWQTILFLSFDHLIPIITLNEAHHTLIFGDLTVRPPISAQPNFVVIYFYIHKLIGWILGFFLVSGFAGLTQSK